MSDGYKGNNLLKGINEKIEWTAEQIQEWIRCKDDPIYFIEKYVKIVTLDHGLQPMKMYDFQKEIVTKGLTNRKLIVKCARQLGKCHSEDTNYTIRNKKTGEILTLTAKEFHEMSRKKLP